MIISVIGIKYFARDLLCDRDVINKASD